MSAYLAPKAVINALVAALRASTTAPLATCVVRKGPQRGYRAGAEPGVVFVSLDRLEAEDSAGSGNNWWNRWRVTIDALIPDDDTETSYDLLLDLVEAIGLCIHDNRTLSDAAKVVSIAEAQIGLATITEPTEQTYHAAKITVRYRTLRGG